jgi:hypothetical protein
MAVATHVTAEQSVNGGVGTPGFKPWPTSDRVAGGGGTYRDHTLRHGYLRKHCQGVRSGSGDKGEGSGAERPELMAAQRN